MNVAVIGLGFMGAVHLKALANIATANVVAVVDESPERLTGDLSAIQGNLGRPGESMDFSRFRKYSSLDEALNDREIEAVDICLPTHLHGPAAIQALQAGKHALVEKPMALNGAVADRMLAEAEKARRTLMVAQVLRFMPQYEALDDVVRSGAIGRVHSAFFRRRTATPTWAPWEFDSSKNGGGVFDLLVHDVDFCLRLFGAPEAISSVGTEAMAAGVDMVVGELHYPDIGNVTITGGWHHVGDYPFSMEYTVIGEKASVEFNSDGRPPTLYPSGGRARPLPQGAHDGYQAEIEYFVECCRSGARPVRCPPEESAKAVKLARLMVDSRVHKGEKVACNL
ncbi:MAG: Gfo/Idh/MocA family oxidoreductase [Bryobacteraceae bacterium]|nr:Gfo/Idh/MocA family oxidoreductase [Bryobacteraceae bacterium]